MGRIKHKKKKLKHLINHFKNGNNDLEQNEGYLKVINTDILNKYNSIKQALDFKVAPIDPTIPHTPAGEGLLAWGIGSSVVNKAGMPGLLGAGKHNNLPTKTNHHPSTSVAPNLPVKQQSSAKSGKTLNATIKIAKQVKAINHDEPSSSYSEENEQQPIIRVERSIQHEDEGYLEIQEQDYTKILVVRTRKLDIDEIIRLIKKNPTIDQLDILPFTINDQKTKDLITELSKHNIHNMTFIEDTSPFYNAAYPPLQQVSDNSTFKDILGDNQNSLSTETDDVITCESDRHLKESILRLKALMAKNIADDVYTVYTDNLCFNYNSFSASFFKEQLKTNPNVNKLFLNYDTMNSGTAKLLGEILKDTSINTLIIEHSLKPEEVKDLASIIKGTNINKLILRESDLDFELVIGLANVIRENNITELDISDSHIDPRMAEQFLQYLKYGTVTKFTFEQDNKFIKAILDVDGNIKYNPLETSATPESHTALESYATPKSHTALEETVSKEGILWGIVGGVGALALSGFGVYALYKKFFGNEKVEKSPDSNQTVELELRDSPPPPYDDNDPTYEQILDNISNTSIAIDVYSAEDTSSTIANATTDIDNNLYNIDPTKNIPISSSSQEVAAMSNISNTNNVGHDTVEPAEEPQNVTTGTSNIIPNTNNDGEYKAPICTTIYVNTTEAPQGVIPLGAAGGDDTYIV